MMLVHSYLHQKSHFIQSRTELLLSSPHLTGKGSHIHLNQPAYGGHPIFFFHGINYRLLKTFWFPSPKCITLRFQLLTPFLQYFNSPLLNFYFRKYLLSLPLCLITSFLYLIINIMYIITEFPLFRGKIIILFALENDRLFITMHLWQVHLLASHFLLYSKPLTTLY